MSQSFLFLQGVASPFFAELGKALVNKGHRVKKVNFCGGDWFFSRALSTVPFKQPLDSLNTFLNTLYQQDKITDIILFGDSRPIHQVAIEIAKKSKITIHVFEEGYFRPSWITLEQGGVNAHSHLMTRQPDWFIQTAKTLSPANTPLDTGKQIKPRAYHDMRYHFLSLLTRRWFPHYRTHRPDSPLTEYIGWIKRFPTIFFVHKKHAEKAIQKILTQQQPFYVLPLQLNADTQIKRHSSIQSMADLIHTSIQSFTQHAPENSLLVIKNHPLDTGLTNYPAIIQDAITQTAQQINPNRIIYLETGDLNALLEKATGALLVNSTVGLSALGFNCPTIALGKAIYAKQGLSYQGSLDQFWQDSFLEHAKPDENLFDAFKQVVIATTQVNGDFYTKKGIELAVENCVGKLIIASNNDTNSDTPKNTETTANDSFEQTKPVLSKA